MKDQYSQSWNLAKKNANKLQYVMENVSLKATIISKIHLKQNPKGKKKPKNY